MNAAQTVICPPVHTFRLVRKIQHDRAATQSNSDFLRLPKPSVTGRFLLARVCKPITVAAREQATNTVELGDPSTAVHAVCPSGGKSPRAPPPRKCRPPRRSLLPEADWDGRP